MCLLWPTKPERSFVVLQSTGEVWEEIAAAYVEVLSYIPEQTDENIEALSHYTNTLAKTNTENLLNTKQKC
jgi:hypothetical protein